MRGNVTFRSTFPVDLERHPPGEELATYLADQMTQAGLLTRVVDNYEDFAWWIEAQAEQRMPWAILGYVGDGPAEWLIQINSSVSWLGRLLGRSDADGLRLFTERLHSVLVDDAHFSEVRWHVGEWSEPGWTGAPDE